MGMLNRGPGNGNGFEGMMSRKMKAVEFTGPGGQLGVFDEEGVNTRSWIG